jgi:hypothetical protein
MRMLLLSFAFVFALVIPALAADKDKEKNSNTRSVQGSVSDSTNAVVEGAVVQIKDTKTLQIRSYITKQDGAYHFHGLSPDVDYEIKADHQGSSSGSKTLSSFDSRKTAIINLKLNK